jgi:hypothetical protein
MFERISIFTAVFALLAGPGLWALSQAAVADEQARGGFMMASEEVSREATGANPSHSGVRSSASASATANASAGTGSSASASAKATASSSAGASGRDGCRAESSSSAEARAGDEYAYDEDRDSAYDESGDCRAEAKSRAKATAGQRGGE